MGLATVRRNLCVVTLVLALFIPSAQAEEVVLPKLVLRIPLPDVEGRIDHLAIDLQGQRLFVAVLGNDTVEVIDLQTGRRIRTLRGFHEPQGIAFIADLHELAVTNGGDGTCELFDGQTFARLHTISLSKDADNVRYDPVTRRLYVGYGNGAIAVIDPSDGTLVGNIQLKAHPESFQLEAAGSRMYVNVPEAREIAVLDRAQQRTIAEWPTTVMGQANFPMALDEARHRLFIGFRKPAKLAVLDTMSGTVVAAVDCVGDADEILYDSARKRLYVSGGEGSLDVFTQASADTYRLLARIPTAVGSRTALYVPERNQLFLAVPHHGSQSAEIRIYEDAVHVESVGS